MNTFLSDAQEEQLDKYRSFAADVVAPVAALLVGHEVCLQEFLKKMAQAGYLGITVPKEYGGQGGSLLDLVLLVEQIGCFEPGLGLTLGEHVGVIELLKRFGSDEQKARYLPMLSSGESFATLAFSEENAGTDFEAVESTLREDSLTSKKSWVVSADFATLFAVLCKDAEGLALLLVTRPGDDKFKLGEQKRLMGLRSAHINDIELSKVNMSSFSRINCGAHPARTKVSAAGAALHAMSVAKVVLAAAGVGLLERSCQLALEHARQRKQFGANIGSFQGIQWKLADMGVDTVSSRLQLYRAAWSYDQDPGNFMRYAAMCKILVARSARVNSAEALQVMGAPGLLQDGPLARFYDDAKVIEIAEGTSEFQKILLTRELNM